MLLIWSCGKDETVDWFESKYLASSGLDWVRFNTENFPEQVSLSLTPSTFTWSDTKRRFGPKDVGCVWYRRPMPSEFAVSLRPVEEEYARNEAEKALVAMRDLMTSVMWLNWPERNQIAEQKVRQLRQAAEIGFTCPSTIVSNDPSEIMAFVERHGGQILVKPLHRGTVIEDGRQRAFYSTLLSAKDLSRDLRSLAICPLIYQQFVAKAFELRVTVVDGECFAVRLDSQDRSSTVVDWRRDPYPMRHSAFELPPEIAQRCVRLTQKNELLFTAFDLIVTPQGEYVFLEHNPNGQFAWLEERAGVPIGRALLNLFRKSSACP